ncbi:MAG: hypothetical protein ACRDZP_01720, partial [Acidimicrobiales bacterium]
MRARRHRHPRPADERPVRAAPALDRTGLLSGALVGTAVMTALMEGAQAGRVTRMSLPYLLGTMVTTRRPLVRIWGTALH